MNTDDVIKTYEFLSHKSVEMVVISPAQFRGDPNAGIKAIVTVDSLDKFVALCSEWDGKANVYVGLGELKKGYTTQKGHRAGKKDIQAVRFVFLDIDAVKSDDSMRYQASTANEWERAMEAGKFLWGEHLPKECGFQNSAFATSGNGSYVILKIPRYDLAGEPVQNGKFEFELRIKAFYDEIQDAIDKHFKGKVKIDTVQDVSRIGKVIGTMSVKGDPVKFPDRPHRVSYWVDVPDGDGDKAFLEYILSLPIQRPAMVTGSQTTGKKPQAQGLFVKPQLSDAQEKVLEIALKAPYVKLARDKQKFSDMSISDWAFLKELEKEGIRNPEMLTCALMGTRGTKFDRDQKGNYLIRTVENFVNRLPGVSLTDGRRQLEREFDKLDLKGIVVCGATVGLGKTFCAKKKVIEAVNVGTNVLVIVPSHTLAAEWESLELSEGLLQAFAEHGVKPVLHLYGITHEDVNCAHKTAGMRLLGIGHSKLFKQKYCYGVCEKKKECLHLLSVAQAKDAPILIAQHEHSHIHQGFFNLKTLGNDDRRLIIIDELAQFVHAVRLTKKDLFGNMKLYRVIADEKAGKHTDVFFWDFLSDRLEGMLKAIENRQGYEIPERFFAVSPTDANKLDAEITKYYIKIERVPKVKNLLWDLRYLLEHKPAIQYDDDTDSLLYRWRPDFGKRDVLILSGTTRRGYVEKQLERPVDGIAENWNIRRDNLKVVQLITGMGGRNRLLKQCDGATFMKQHGKLFHLMLHKHRGKRIALITSLGERAPGTKNDGSAKGKILRALSPIAAKHEKKIVSVSNDMLQKNIIPDGENEVALFHFGMKGIDKLNGKFDVIWVMNAHYYHRQAIQQAMFDRFNVKPDLDKDAVDVEFVSSDPNMKFKTKAYVYDALTELELEHTQIADMVQTIGRFLREEAIYKVIYLTHNVNVEPYPSRVYRSWEALFQYEFAPYVPPDAWLTGKAADAWEWIKENVTGATFTADDVAQGVEMSVQNITRRHLKHFTSTGLIKIVSDGKKGRGHATVYKCPKLAET